MKKIILGVSSSISAYKACDLSRLFVKDGHSVFVVLTENAAKLVTPLTFEALTGNPVCTDTFARGRGGMDHISLKEGADLFVVAPATASIIGKFANGIADDLLSTTYLSVTCPVIIAPAMNPDMYSHPAVKENLEILAKRGTLIIGPDEGEVACGDRGRGRLADINSIYEAAQNVLKG